MVILVYLLIQQRSLRHIIISFYWSVLTRNSGSTSMSMFLISSTNMPNSHVRRVGCMPFYSCASAGLLFPSCVRFCKILSNSISITGI